MEVVGEVGGDAQHLAGGHVEHRHVVGRAIAERLLEAHTRGMWQASDTARKSLVDAVLEAEGWEEQRT